MDNRYMIVKYIKKPDGKYDEVTEFKRHYRSTDLQMSKVILDLGKKAVIKNGLNPMQDMMTCLSFTKEY